MNRRPAGFTLVELMIVVAIIGILAVIAIPSLIETMRRARQTEVGEQLSAIGKKQKILFDERGQFSVGTAAQLPTAIAVGGLACCGGRGGGHGVAGSTNNGKCTGDASLFVADPVWKDMSFAIDEETSYVYEYSGTSNAYTARATTDADCDGVPSVYTLAGQVDSMGQPSAVMTRPATGTY